MNDCPHRRSPVMMRAHSPDHCPDCARENAAAATAALDEDESGRGSNFNRDVLMLTAAVYGAPALAAAIALVAFFWRYA